MGHSRVSSDLLVVRAYQHCGFLCVSAVDRVLFEAFGGVPVEDEEERASFVDEQLVFGVVGADVLMVVAENGVLGVECEHGLIEVEELMVFEIGPVCQVPTSSAMLVAPVVALPGEVDPLGVPELVPHEI